LQKHKDKITTLSSEVSRLREELRKSTEENGEIKKDFSILKQQNERLKKQIDDEVENPAVYLFIFLFIIILSIIKN
jgi:hypothetical protein